MDQTDTTTTTSTAETPTKREASRLRLLAMLLAFAKAILRFVRRLLGLATETASELKGNAVDAIDTARRGVEATGRVVGAGLHGPAVVLDAAASAIGATLGAVLPRPPVTPADVARGAVAQDDCRETTAGYAPVEVGTNPAPPPLLTPPILVKAHATASLDRTGRKAEGLIALDPRHAEWLAGLTLGERLMLAAATPDAIGRHLDESKRLPGVSPMISMGVHYGASKGVADALAILEALPTRRDLSVADAFKALGVGVGVNDDEPEDEHEPVARFGR